MTELEERKQFEDSLIFLAEASKILSASLNIRETLQTVSQVAVSSVADWCSVDLINPEGDIDMVAISHKDPAKVKWAKKLREKYPPDLSADSSQAKVIKTGKPEFYPYITQEIINKSTQDKKIIRLIGKLGLTAVIIVPLKIRGKVIGTMQFVSAESKRKFTKTDLQIAEQIADRAGVAIENSLLYEDVNSERKRLNDLISNVPGVVWEIFGSPYSKERRISFVSNYVKKMLGYSPEEWYKNPSFGFDIIHQDDRRRVMDEASEIFSSGNMGTLRFRWITKKGDIVFIESHIYVIKNSEGKPIGIRGVNMDITERMEIERRKDEFISMASHELKTPLTTIKVFSHLLGKDMKYDKQKSDLYLSKVDDQIDKLENLVNDLLDISKIQTGKMNLRKEKFSLKNLIDETVEEMKIITKENIILSRVEDEFVYADKERLSQVLVNLLSNAIKYSPANAPVEVNAKKDTDRVIVSVKDKGLGISREHQQKIFERFYRVYDNFDKTFPGLGMGLYISNEIIKRHEGRMWLRSQNGKGSTFYFSLPLLSKN